MKVQIFYIICVTLFIDTDAVRIQVQVKEGRIIGLRKTTIFSGKFYYAFYGVPYAQPPEGELRFKDPKPEIPWGPPLDCSSEYIIPCAQTHLVQKNELYGAEQCLYLNVFTPVMRITDEIKRSVIVWLQGLAFEASFSHAFGPDFLIDKDVIVVSVAYRIGVFGFVRSKKDDTGVNMGLKDIILALKWIRNNIKHFGGDKTKITVMASGSAATHVSLLLLTKARKLFSTLILQSGTIFSPSLFQVHQKTELNRFKKELKKISYDRFKNASTADLIKAGRQIYNSKDMINKQRIITPFSPTIEPEKNNSLLMYRPETLIKYARLWPFKMPLLIGFNSQESILQNTAFIQNPRYLSDFERYFRYVVPFSDGCSYNQSSKVYKTVSKIIKSRYFPGGISETSIDNFLKYNSDVLVYPIIRFINTFLKLNKASMYVYKFNYVGNFNAYRMTATGVGKTKIKGASHGDENCYLMRCEPLNDMYNKLHQNDSNHQDILTIKAMTEMWTNFAKSGKPTNDNSKVSWPPITANKNNVLHISRKLEVVSLDEQEDIYKFWNTIYDDYYAPERCRKKRNKVRDEL